MEHQMKLNPLPFKMIASGFKTYELRLNDEKRKQVCKGDTILFTEIGSGSSLKVLVLERHEYADFADLYASLPLSKCGYDPETIQNASPEDMRVYYSLEDERKYGALALEIRLIEE